MQLKNKNVLVTGAAGFIGSHLIEELVKKGAKVKALVRYNSAHNLGNLDFLDKRIKDNIEIYFGDIREMDILAKAMQGTDAVFNLAALVGIPYSYLNPHEVVMTNMVGTLNMLTVARDLGVKKFIQTSTSEVYGSPDNVPIKETDRLKPQSPYSASKIAADSIALSFFYSFSFPVAIIRPFNTYGPRQSARAVIPAIICQALKGNNVKLGSLAPRRDFTFVKDTVEGFIKVCESDKSVGNVINIGTGSDYSIGDAVGIIGEIVGRKLKVIQQTKRIRPSKSEVVRLKADNSKAVKLLNWRPNYTFQQGLRITVDFIRDNPRLYDPKEYAI